MKKILLTFSIVGFLASGCNYSQPTSQSTLPTNQPNNQQVKVVPSPYTAPIDTSNWQTYSNSNLGLTIKYPKDWFITSPYPKLEFSNVAKRSPLGDEALRNEAIFRIGVEDSTNKLSINNWFAKLSASGFSSPPQSQETVSIGTYPAIKIFVPDIGNWAYNYIGVGSKVYDVSYLAAADAKTPSKFLDTYQAIIDSIQFQKKSYTFSNSIIGQTSKWNSYSFHNKTYSFKYPDTWYEDTEAANSISGDKVYLGFIAVAAYKPPYDGMEANSGPGLQMSLEIAPIDDKFTINDLSVKDWLANQTKKATYNYQLISVNSLNGIEIYYPPESQITDSKQYIIWDANFVIKLEFTTSTKNLSSSDLQTIQQIISTFR